MNDLAFNRRDVLQVGFSGVLGLGLSQVLAGQARAAAGSTRKPKSVLLIFLTGAPSHIDTFDMKPDAPEEIRGAFKPIATRTTGYTVCEHLPRLAARSDRFAVIRSMTHGLPSHEHATHYVLTGIDEMPPGATHMASRADWPCFASGLDYVSPRTDGVPTGVMLPTYLNNGYGFSGQHAGILGPKYDPWQIRNDPNPANFRVDDLVLGLGVTAEQLRERESLVRRIDRQQAVLADLAPAQAFTTQQEQALRVLTAGKLSQAFRLEREPDAVRDRYGRHMFGQSLLLARRLLEVGVSVVQANMGHMNTWDTHTNNCRRLKDELLPPLDMGVSALLDDLHSRGMLEETLIVMVGEFGRTPRMGTDNGGNITRADGRDHWAGVFFAMLAGGGVHGGQVIGSSDRIGAYPATKPYKPSDLGATIYSTLGVDPATVARDRLGRPLRLNLGHVIRPLFTGRANG